MPVTPVEIKRLATDRLLIVWSDGITREYTANALRNGCPCANCKEKRLHPPPATLLPVLSAAETQPVTIRGMHPVGNYAYSIDFSDGHDTGIYTFPQLVALGTVVSTT
ncbi:MAG: DUF971 domain-containing protein [Planctomycetota bacterium]|nr:DUF971 domain-containing protein [Planctomycetota bacterium]